jgi:hypothetical protein
MPSPQSKKGCRQLKQAIENLKTKFRELYTLSNTDLTPEDIIPSNCVTTHNKYYELSTFIDEMLPKLKTEIFSQITRHYTYKDKESGEVKYEADINLDIEQSIESFITFYTKRGINIPPNFRETIREIWYRNHTEIRQAIEQQGFDDMLIVPGNISITEIKDKMEMESGYYEWDSFKEGGAYTGATKHHPNKPRIILVHKTQNLKDRPELRDTLNIKGQDVVLDHALDLDDYMTQGAKFYDDSGQTQHLDAEGWTWLATKSGARLVSSGWRPGDHQLGVFADDLGYRSTDLGVRSARYFF